MNAATQERLAKWWAGKLGDEVVDKTDEVIMRNVLGGRIFVKYWHYTSSMETARRALEWAVVKSDDGDMGHATYRTLACAISNFRDAAWSDTPTALLELAVACGFDREKEEVR